MAPLSKKKRIVRKHTQVISKNIRRYVLGGAIILIVSLVLYSTNYVTSIPSLQIKTISVTGGETVSHTLVRETAWKALDGSYAKLIPRTFSYLYPEEDMYSLLHDVPRVKDVFVERVSMTSITVSFTEYFPTALWCDEISETSKCIFMDIEAFGYSDAPSVRGASFIQYIDEDIIPKKHTQSPFIERMRNTQILQTQLKDVFPYTIRAVVYTKHGDVTYYLLGGGEIRTTGDDDPSYTVSRISALLSHKKYTHLAKEPFVYIDLRFGSKVYVKEKETEVEASTVDESVPVIIE